METNIIYKYRAPGAHPHDDTTITTSTTDVEPNEMMRNPHPVGEVISLRADDPNEYGEQPKEYVVLDRFPLLTQMGDSGYRMSALTVIVTDA